MGYPRCPNANLVQNFVHILNFSPNLTHKGCLICKSGRKLLIFKSDDMDDKVSMLCLNNFCTLALFCATSNLKSLGYVSQNLHKHTVN